MLQVRKNKVSLVLFTAVSFGELKASTKEGNSGFAVVCDTARFESMNYKQVMLLDFYEGSNFYKLSIDLGPEQLGYEEKVGVALARLRRLDPARAAHYQKSFEEFLLHKTIGNFALTGLLDRGPIEVPDTEHCSVVNIAQRKPAGSTGYDDTFYIIQNLWNMLDSTNKAGLALHEVVYRDAINQGIVDSDLSRKFVAILSSTEFINYTSAQYEQLLGEIGFTAGSTHPSASLSLRDYSILKARREQKTKFEGRWASGCLAMGAGDPIVGQRLLKSFEGHMYSETAEIYQDNNCETKLASLSDIYYIDRLGEVDPLRSNADLSLIKVEATIYHYGNLVDANLKQLAGYSNWVAGYPKDVTDRSLDKRPPAHEGKKMFTFFALDSFAPALWFGDLRTGQDGSTSERRPKEKAPAPLLKN